jgi:hypothetical protein
LILHLTMATKPLTPLPNLSLHESTIREQIDAGKIIDAWLSSLENSLKTKDTAAIPELFLEDSWWRDVVAVSFDISTKEGQASISEYIQSSTAAPRDIKAIKDGGLAPKLMDMGGMLWLESGFTFETNYGSCRGIIRLVNTGPEKWKAWTVSTGLDSLKGQEDVKPAESGSDEEVQVLVVGAGKQTYSSA